MGKDTVSPASHWLLRGGQRELFLPAPACAESSGKKLACAALMPKDAAFFWAISLPNDGLAFASASKSGFSKAASFT